MGFNKCVAQKIILFTASILVLSEPVFAKKKKQDISKELNLSIPKLYTECNKMKRDMKRCLGILD